MPAAPVTDCLGGRELRTFDQSRRISIPTKFRARYGNNIYLLKTFMIPGEECIVIYNEDDYLGVYDDLAEVYEGSDLAYMQRMLANNIATAYIDKAGRFSLPDGFLEHASLSEEKEALMVCHPDRIEIWNESKWNGLFETEKKPDFSKMNLSPKRKK